jgi:hypothetical protein
VTPCSAGDERGKGPQAYFFWSGWTDEDEEDMINFLTIPFLCMPIYKKIDQFIFYRFLFYNSLSKISFFVIFLYFSCIFFIKIHTICNILYFFLFRASGFMGEMGEKTTCKLNKLPLATQINYHFLLKLSTIFIKVVNFLNKIFVFASITFCTTVNK